MAKIIDEPHALDDEQLDAVAGGSDPFIRPEPEEHLAYRCPACRKGWIFVAGRVPEDPRCDCGLPNNSLYFELSLGTMW